MSISKEIKKKVKIDWLNAFSELRSYSANKLYKISGPLIFGLDISPLPPGHVVYRPILECFGLWDENLQACLKFATIFAQFYDPHGLQLDFNLKAHEIVDSNPISGAVMLIREQSKIPFEGNVKFSQLCDELDRFTSNRNYMNRISVQVDSFEMKIKTAIYLGEKQTANLILNEAAEISKSWDASSSHAYIGRREDWLDGIKHEIENPDKLVNNVNNNLANPKLKNLHRSALIVG